MKKLLLLALIFIVGKVAVDRFTQSRDLTRTDRNMTRIVEEMNQNLPQTTEFMRIEAAEYSNHTMRLSGVLLGNRLLTDENKTDIQQKLKVLYCGNAALRSANVGVEYSFQGVGVRSYNDKVHAESWSTTVQPQSCN